MKLIREPEWVTLYESQDEYMIRIRHMQLQDAGVPAVIFDQRDSSYQAFGYIYLKVKQNDLDRARKILNEGHE